MTGLSKFIIVFLIISLACENESVRKVLSKRKSDGGSSRGPVSKISVLCVRGSGDNLQVLLTPGQNKTGSSVEPYYVIPGGKVEHGETLPQAAIRELKEEANYDVEEKNLTEQSTELYVAWNCRKSGQPAKKRIGICWHLVFTLPSSSHLNSLQPAEAKVSYQPAEADG
uniref:Nudix hydrolase domain-containing protein n=1 Tax=Ditylenchus dipsaci TaxID=166011 RepID=A0A915CNJ3_9BILA